MKYLVVMDSCGEMTAQMKQDPHFLNAPLTIEVGDHHIVDDETFDQKDFLERVAACPDSPKSACPSPAFYEQAFAQDNEHIFAVTLSAELSGSYNSAELGKAMALEADPEKKIYVFNSRSASIGETLIAQKIMECEEKDMSFEEIIDCVETYISEQNTWFVLETLETLRKNGRLSNLKAKVASVLNIKPVMGATPQGTILQLSQARGMNKALMMMVNDIVERTKNAQDRILAISHCNCQERGEMVRDAILERMPCKDVILLDTAGISSMYASDGGIIVVI